MQFNGIYYTKEPSPLSVHRGVLDNPVVRRGLDDPGVFQLPIFTGKLFKGLNLCLSMDFILTVFKPIDWLLGHILWMKFCNWRRGEALGPTEGEPADSLQAISFPLAGWWAISGNLKDKDLCRCSRKEMRTCSRREQEREDFLHWQVEKAICLGILPGPRARSPGLHLILRPRVPSAELRRCCPLLT